jgi:hypothetical protein
VPFGKLPGLFFGAEHCLSPTSCSSIEETGPLLVHDEHVVIYWQSWRVSVRERCCDGDDKSPPLTLGRVGSPTSAWHEVLSSSLAHPEPLTRRTRQCVVRMLAQEPHGQEQSRRHKMTASQGFVCTGPV